MKSTRITKTIAMMSGIIIHPKIRGIGVAVLLWGKKEGSRIPRYPARKKTMKLPVRPERTGEETEHWE
jgi:hypothetical protein